MGELGGAERRWRREAVGSRWSSQQYEISNCWLFLDLSLLLVHFCPKYSVHRFHKQ